MYCKYCGKQIDDNSKFCKYCGKQLAESQRIIVEFKKPNIDKIKINSSDIYSHFISFFKRSKKEFIAIIVFLLSTFAALMFPFSAFFGLEEFVDISYELEFVMAIVCSMMFGAYVTHKVFEDTKEMNEHQKHLLDS